MKKSLEKRQAAGFVLDDWKKAMEARDAETDQAKRQTLSEKATEMRAKYDALVREAAEAEAFEAAEEADAANSPARRNQPKKPEEQRVTERYSMLSAIRSAMSGKALTGLEAEMQQEAIKEARDSKVSGISGQIQVPGFMAGLNRSSREGIETRADLSVGTNSAGGYTVFTENGGLIPILQAKLVTEALGATVLTGLQGPVDFPRNTTDAAMAWEGEVTANDQTDLVFDKLSMSPKRLGGFINESKQLLFQSSINVDAYVRSRMAYAIRKAVDTAAINGSGSSNQPTGILNTSGIGSVAVSTNGGNPTWAHIVSLESSIAGSDADMGTLGYLTTPGVRGKLKQTEKASNTGMFVWTDERSGDSRMGQLNGLDAYTSTIVPSTLTKGTSSGVCHAIIFGNWQELIIGQWAGLDIVVDAITLAANAQVKIIINSWWDIGVKHAPSFAAVKDATIS